MPRIRLGVALLIPEPVRSEIDGLRKAVGAGAYSRIPPHITLVPPVNVRVDALEAARRVIRNAAEMTLPLGVVLENMSTFRSESPVVKLDVRGVGANALARLRELLFVEPLERTVSHDFIPHVTVHDNAALAFRDQAIDVLKNYVAEVNFDSVYLLQQGDDRVWRAISDACFGRPVVIGAGGLSTTLRKSHLPDSGCAPVAIESQPYPENRHVVTAWRDGDRCGAAWGFASGDVFEIESCEVAAAFRHQGVGSALLRELLSEAAKRGCRVALATGDMHAELSDFLAKHGFGGVDHSVRQL